MTKLCCSSKNIKINLNIAICTLMLVQVGYPAQVSDTLTILHISDTHLCNLIGYQSQFVEDRLHYGDGVASLKTFLKTTTKTTAADMVIITGDLIDYYEAETIRGSFLATQIEQFVPLFNNCPVPLFVTLGNHDISSYWIEEMDNSKHSFQQHAVEARACWIRNLSCLQNGSYFCRTFDIGNSHYFFIFLDNGYSLQNGAYLDKMQLDWLNYQIKSAGQHPVILFMHKYLPVADYNNDGVLFSNNSFISINDSSCSKGFFKTLNENKNIKAIFAGHGHKNVLEDIPFPAGHTILQTETAGFAQNTNHWRLLKFTENSIIIYAGGADNKIDFIKKIAEIN